MAGLYERFLQGATLEDTNAEQYEAPSSSVLEPGSADFN